MESGVPTQLLERLAALTSVNPDAIQSLLLGPKEHSAGVKALRWFTKQKGLTGLNKKMETAADAAVSAAILPCLQTLLQHLHRPENLCQEGLFRKSGSISRQRSLKQRLLDGGCLDANAYTAHDYATVFKSMMADMPDPLLTRRLYNAYIFVHGMHIKERKVEAMKILMSLLPASNYSIARDLLCLLHDVAQHVTTTKMTSSGLATIFTPHIMCPRLMSPSELLTASRDTQPCVSFMIEHAHTIFKAEDMADCSDVPENGRPRWKSAVDLNASSSSRRHSGGTKRRHSDHGGGPSNSLLDPCSADQCSPMKRKHEESIAPVSSYEIVPVVRLVRLCGAVLEASPFARRDAAVYAQSLRPTSMAAGAASSRPRTRSPCVVTQLPSSASPLSAKARRRPVLSAGRASPAVASSRATSNGRAAVHSKPPKPLPRRSLVAATPLPAPRMGVVTGCPPC